MVVCHYWFVFVRFDMCILIRLYDSAGMYLCVFSIFYTTVGPCVCLSVRLCVCVCGVSQEKLFELGGKSVDNGVLGTAWHPTATNSLLCVRPSGMLHSVGDCVLLTAVRITFAKVLFMIRSFSM